MKKIYIWLLLIINYTTVTTTVAQSELPQERACSMCNNSNSCCSSVNSLTLCTLCADKINTRCMNVERSVDTPNLCAQKIRTRTFCTPSITIESLCSPNLQTNDLCAEQAQANTFCSQEANMDSLCSQQISVDGEVCAKGNFRACNALSARAILDHDTIYTLGDIIPFNVAASDPLGSFHFSPTRYITPENGLYMIAVQVPQKNMSGDGVIVGTPVGIIELVVNGQVRRKNFSPFLSFATRQTAHLTTQMYLNKDDELTVHYKVLVVDENMGLREYPGTTTLGGLSTPSATRAFIIVHYLGSDCDEFDCPCPVEPCQPCVVECTLCSSQPCTTCCPTALTH